MTRCFAPLLLALATSVIQANPIHVTTVSLADKSFFKEFSAPATTQSLNQSQISAELQGRIEQIQVLVGDQVKAGEGLIQLDCRDYRLQLRQAEAALGAIDARVTLARQQIARTQSLRKQRNVSEERLNQQQSDLKRAQADRLSQQAAIEAARINVERCLIRAPFDGTVTARPIGEGSWVSPGQPLLELVDARRLEVTAQIALDQAESLSAASNIELQTNVGQFPLSLRQLVPVIASRGRNREARLIFTGQPALPGTTGRLRWHSQLRYLEADLPVRRGNQLGLFLLDGTSARFYPLTDAREGQPARVDLPDDTVLILEGRHSLEDGDPVEVSP